MRRQCDEIALRGRIDFEPLVTGPRACLVENAANVNAALEDGPDVVWQLQTGTAKMLSSTPQIAAIDQSIQNSIAMELSLRGLSPAEATADPKYMAAITLRVLNQTRDEKREARLPFAMDMETRRLWPTMASVATLGGMPLDAAAKMSITFGPLASSTDEAGQLAISDKLITLGWSTSAREMVRSGYAPDEVAAQVEIDSNLEVEEETPPTFEPPQETT